MLLNRYFYLFFTLILFSASLTHASFHEREEQSDGPYKKFMKKAVKDAQKKGLSTEQAALISKFSRIVDTIDEVYEEEEEKTLGSSCVSLITRKATTIKEAWSELNRGQKMLVAAPMIAVAAVSGAYFVMFMSDSAEVLEILNVALNTTISHFYK